MSEIHLFKHTWFAGQPLSEARRAMIMVHGRGANADSILALADHLDVADFALVAPNATGNTWYPRSFLSPEEQNEPYLSNALNLLSELVAHLKSAGFTSEQLYFAGFSQGACLTAEFTARHAERYGGIFLFTGGVIGELPRLERYQGDFAGTPVLIGCGNPDFHVPVERVYATSNIFRELGAAVTERIYPNIGHTIVADEIEIANWILAGEA